MDSFGVPSDVRHAHQISVVQTIGEVVEGVKAKLQAALDAEANNVSSADVEKADLDNKVLQATEYLNRIVEDVKAKKLTVDELTKELGEKKQKLAETQKHQKAGDASVAAAKTEKTDFQVAIADQLEPLLRAELEADQVSTHYKALLPCMSKLTLVESLTTPLPGICEKKTSARGQFDNMVLQQLEKCFTEHLAALETTIENEAPASAERAAAVATAQNDFDASQGQQQEATIELSNAQASQQEAESALKAAKAAVADYAAEYEKVTAVRDEKAQALTSFVEYDYECYKVSRDKVSQKEVPVETQAKVMEPVEEIVAPVCEAGA